MKKDELIKKLIGILNDLDTIRKNVEDFPSHTHLEVTMQDLADTIRELKK